MSIAWLVFIGLFGLIITTIALYIQQLRVEQELTGIFAKDDSARTLLKTEHFEI